MYSIKFGIKLNRNRNRWEMSLKYDLLEFITILLANPLHWQRVETAFFALLSLSLSLCFPPQIRTLLNSSPVVRLNSSWGSPLALKFIAKEQTNQQQQQQQLQLCLSRRVFVCVCERGLCICAMINYRNVAYGNASWLRPRSRRRPQNPFCCY